MISALVPNFHSTIAEMQRLGLVIASTFGQTGADSL